MEKIQTPPTRIEDFTPAQRELWHNILGISRDIFLAPTLQKKPFLDTVEPGYHLMREARMVAHQRRGCVVPNEVSVVVPSKSSLGKTLSSVKNIEQLNPWQYENHTKNFPESEFDSIAFDLRHHVNRFSGTLGDSGNRIVILDSTTNYYKAGINRLVDLSNPGMPPTRLEGQSDESFLEGKDFRRVEEFVFSENPEDALVHSIASHQLEDGHELSFDEVLGRLSGYLGYLALDLHDAHDKWPGIQLKTNLPEIALSA